MIKDCNDLVHFENGMKSKDFREGLNQNFETLNKKVCDLQHKVSGLLELQDAHSQRLSECESMYDTLKKEMLSLLEKLNRSNYELKEISDYVKFLKDEIIKRLDTLDKHFEDLKPKKMTLKERLYYIYHKLMGII